MFKKMVTKMKYYSASMVTSFLVLVAVAGVGSYSWLYTYQPEPPK
jgi:cyclic lactone autoinducer peptide